MTNLFNKKTKIKISENKVFGIEIENQTITKNKIPRILDESFQYINIKGLQEEGIFRKNGSKKNILELKNMFDSDKEQIFLDNNIDVHEGNFLFFLFFNFLKVTGLVKLYFRELPIPLFPFEIFLNLLDFYKNLLIEDGFFFFFFI
jgi:hypothetical protein